MAIALPERTATAAGTLTPREIVRGQELGLQRLFLRPALLVLAIDLVLVALYRRFYSSGTEPASEYLAWGVGIVAFVLDLVALGRLSLALGVTGRGENRGAIGSVLLVMVGPWALLFVTLTLLQGLRALGLGFDWGRSDETPILAWFLLTLLCDAAALGIAAWILPGRLRGIAASAYQRAADR